MKYLIFLSILISCNSHQNLSTSAAKEIEAADRAMSDKASKDGFLKTLLSYADTHVVKPKEGELPVIGKQALEKYWNGKTDFKELTWEPYKAEASASGDLGYTLGNWKFTKKDTTLYGNYCTIWKKQADGNWKFVFDGGNNTPKP
jgi:ketosteroid isomerase-like protein